MKRIIYIGLDDTDVTGSPGTGRVARGLADYLASQVLGYSKGVIRHQLLVDPRIRYTSHNSSKCILFETENSPLELQQPCIKYLAENFQEGSDPGLCICTKEQVTEELLEFGHLAQGDFIQKKNVINLANKAGVLLIELGGTGEGIIGALAAVALTVGGNDGRYVQLRGIKEVAGLITVEQVKVTTDTTCVIDEEGHLVSDKEMIDSLGWLRPSLVGGQPVLCVRLSNNPAGKRIWEPIERKHRKHTDHEGGERENRTSRASTRK
jgi:hypothetical protein